MNGFDWTRFVGLGNALLEDGKNSNDEAKLRTAIGRFYYGAFKTVCEVSGFEGKGTAADHGNLKDALPLRLSSKTDNNLTKTNGIIESLDYLRVGRTCADYDGSLFMESNKNLNRQEITIEEYKIYGEDLKEKAQEIIEEIKNLTFANKSSG